MVQQLQCAQLVSCCIMVHSAAKQHLHAAVGSSFVACYLPACLLALGWFWQQLGSYSALLCAWYVPSVSHMRFLVICLQLPLQNASLMPASAAVFGMCWYVGLHYRLHEMC